MGPTIAAALDGGQMKGESVEGRGARRSADNDRDLVADDGSTCRYRLADWAHTRPVSDLRRADVPRVADGPRRPGGGQPARRRRVRPLSSSHRRHDRETMLSHAQNRTPRDAFVRISTPARPCPNLPWHRRAPWARQPQSRPTPCRREHRRRNGRRSHRDHPVCPPEVLVPALATGPVDVVISLGRELIAVAIIESPATEGRETWAAQAAERQLGRAGRGGRVKSPEAGPAGNNPGARPVGTITSRRRDRLRGQSRFAAVRSARQDQPRSYELAADSPRVRSGRWTSGWAGWGIGGLSRSIARSGEVAATLAV